MRPSAALDVAQKMENTGSLRGATQAHLQAHLQGDERPTRADLALVTGSNISNGSVKRQRKKMLSTGTGQRLTPSGRPKHCDKNTALEEPCR